MQLTPNDVDEFLNLAVEFSVWDDRFLSHLHKRIASMHQFSWFPLENLEGVYECAKGTPDRTALADLLFGFLMINILNTIRRQLDQVVHGLHCLLDCWLQLHHLGQFCFEDLCLRQLGAEVNDLVTQFAVSVLLLRESLRRMLLIIVGLLNFNLM